MSDSCIDSCAGTTVQIITAPQRFMDNVSRLYSQISASVEKGELSTGHLVWAWPANALLNIVHIVLSPLIALVNLIAATIFGAFSCCSETCKQAAELFFTNSIAVLSDGLFTSIVRVACPSFRNPRTCATAIYNCITGMTPPPPPPAQETAEACLQMVTTVISELRTCFALLTNAGKEDWGCNGEKDVYYVDVLARYLRACAREALKYEHGDQLVRAIREKLQTEIPEDLSQSNLERVFYFLPSKLTDAWEAQQNRVIEGMRDIQLPDLGKVSSWSNPRLTLLEQIDDDQLGLDSLNGAEDAWTLEIRSLESKEAANRQVIAAVLTGIVQCASYVQPYFNIDDYYLQQMAQNALRFEHPEVLVNTVLEALKKEPIQHYEFLPLFEDLAIYDKRKRATSYGQQLDLIGVGVGQYVARGHYNDATSQVTKLVEARLALLERTPLEPFRAP